MRSIGVRELRQNASKYLRQVEQGETLTITDRGRPVAQLTPISQVEQDLAVQYAKYGITPPRRPRTRFEVIPESAAASSLLDEVLTDREDRDL